MNPGIFILGGGGDGGGSGAGDGEGGDGKTDGKGKNGGKDAKGGGKDAKSCGPGSGGGCPNPQHGSGGTAAGDPIDPVTGRSYTVAVTDLVLPGPLPLVITRSYSTALRDEDIGLGRGVCHSYGWMIDERRRSLTVHVPHALATIAPRPEIDGMSNLPCGRLVRYEWGYAIDVEGARYVLSERVGNRYLLTAVVDRNDNRTTLSYEQGRLTEITDCVGRSVRVRRLRDGHIGAFEVKNAFEQGSWISFREYFYDDLGRLVEARDPLGAAERYEYDEDHRMTRRTEPGGMIVETSYDDVGRAVESYCHRDGNDALDPGVPAFLADGKTKAKGFLHTRIDHAPDFVEIVTSRTVRRVEGNAFGLPEKNVWNGGVHTYQYDKAANLLSYVDGLENEWRILRDDTGRMTGIVDPLGNQTEQRYENGFISEELDALGQVTKYERDGAGNVLSILHQTGPVVSFTYSGRGQLLTGTTPDGAITRLGYDGHGNRVVVMEPNGQVRRMQYDALGRMTEMIDERGQSTRFTYDACGRLTSVRAPRGTSTYEYDADGRRTRVVDRDGRATTLVWGGFHVVTEVRRADGSVVKFFYDREQELVRIVNEVGDEHRLVRSGEGRIVEERTFDGRVVQYEHDSIGQIVKQSCGEAFAEFAYDPYGRVTSRVYSDGTEEKFTYDAAGRIVGAENGEMTCENTYDTRGRLVKETSRWGERVSESEWAYDAMGRVTRVSSGGIDISLQRDIMGRTVGVAFGNEAVRFMYDEGGAEVLRLLPRGGRIERRVDAEGRTVEERVSTGSQALATGAPAWVGGARPGDTWTRSYELSPAGRLMSAGDGTRRGVEIVRDTMGRVTERRVGEKTTESFRYNPSGDLYEPGIPRVYGPGGRLLERGGTKITYDARGRVVTKIDEEGGQWSFVWSDSDRLSEVRRPDDAIIRYVYDAFVRRIQATVERHGKLLSRTRYLWCQDLIVAEARETWDDAGNHSTESIRSVFVPGALVPLAQVRSKGDAPADTVYPLYGGNGFPEAMLSADGQVTATLTPSFLGQLPPTEAALTDLRFMAQRWDADTGLHYNRYRYYNPDGGTYLTPEPMGIEGTLKTYAFAEFRPDWYADPDGLRMYSIVGGYGGPNGTTPITGTGASSSSTPLHPAVEAAMLSPGNAARPDDTAPSNCGEPRALSDYLTQWENSHTPPRRCAPPDPNWQQNLQDALRNAQIGSVQGQKTPKDRSPCPNCSQMIPRLWNMAGLPPPGPAPASGGAIPAPPGILPGMDMAGNKGKIFDPPNNPNWAAGPPAGANQQSPNATGLPFNDASGKPVNPGTWNYDYATGTWVQTS